MKTTIDVLICDHINCKRFQHFEHTTGKILSGDEVIYQCEICKQHFCVKHGVLPGVLISIHLCTCCSTNLINRLSGDGVFKQLAKVKLLEMKGRK